MALVSGGYSKARSRRGRAPADDTQELVNVAGVDRTYFLCIPKLLSENQHASRSVRRRQAR
jgi:hypothetical protein